MILLQINQDKAKVWTNVMSMERLIVSAKQNVPKAGGPMAPVRDIAIIAVAIFVTKFPVDAAVTWLGYDLSHRTDGIIAHFITGAVGCALGGLMVRAWNQASTRSTSKLERNGRKA